MAQQVSSTWLVHTTLGSSSNSPPLEIIMSLHLNLRPPQTLPPWRTATQCEVVGWGQVQLVPSTGHLSPSHRPANYLQI